MYYLFIMRQDLFVCLHWKNPRLTAFLDSNLHTRLAIVTANELGLAFPPRNIPKKFRPDPSTFYLVIVVTDRQTDRQTYAGDSIISHESFRGDNNCLSVNVRDRTPTVLYLQTVVLLHVLVTHWAVTDSEGVMGTRPPTDMQYFGP